MKNLMLVLTLIIGFTTGGCAFLGGAAVGVVGTGAGYEINAHHEMEKLENDFRSGRIPRREYDIRKKQISAGSIVY